MTASIDSRVSATDPDVLDLRDGAREGAPDRTPQPPNRRMGYLPALDGLRAIAVLAVLLYHADVLWIPGGFLGVDVFFVLSGFLITTLLLEGAAARGKPDLKRFYVRRARRLLPAMLAVVIGSTLLVVTVATDGAGNQQRDVPGALTYVLNWVYVLTDQSYFEATGRPPMLEHLWSLAVEEQFYIIWPWLFLLAWRLGRGGRVRRFALIGAGASTVLMALISIMNGSPGETDPSRVYFGTDTHAMGLLIGAALATVWLPQRVRSDLLPGAKLTIDAIGATSLLLLAVVMWRTNFDSVLLYRGGFAAVSCLVALIIVAATHPASRIGRLLGTAPLRYIGTRSYGLYLWHWPVFLVTRPGLDVPLTGLANLVLRLLLTFAAAELSYRFLEMPVRRYGFAGAWKAFLERLTRRGGVFARAAARPALILAVCGAAAALMLVRLYALPSEQNYLRGLTEIEVAQEPEPPSESAESLPTEPAVADGLIGIGESVTIGAGGALERQLPGVVIDAAVGRQAKDSVARIDELAAAGLLREDVFLHIGSNGPVTATELQRAIDALTEAGAERIAVLNVSVPRRWQDPNNTVIEQVLASNPEAVLVDWHGAVLADPDLVVADGIHPSKTGVERYAGLIADALPPAQDDAGPDEGFVDGEPILQNESELADHPALQD